MVQVERLPLEGGGHVLVEVFEVEGEVERIGIGDKAAHTFERAWDTVCPVIHSLTQKVATSGPTETQIKFGVKISSDLNAIIASASGEANFEITLTWKPEK